MAVLRILDSAETLRSSIAKADQDQRLLKYQLRSTGSIRVRSRSYQGSSDPRFPYDSTVICDLRFQTVALKADH